MALVPELTVEIDFQGNPTAQYNEILENDPGVVSFWRMNSVSTFLDSVGPNDGVIVGTPSLTAGPHLVDTDQALAFDGSADGAYVLNDASLIPNKGAFSIEGWVKLPSFPAASRDLVAKRGSWILAVTSAGKLTWTVKDDTSIATVTSSAPLALSGFYHIVCFYDGATIGIIVNGLLDVETAYSSGWELGSLPIRFALTPSTASPVWRSAQTATGNSASMTINVPVSTASGDLLLMQGILDNAQTVTAAPSGWSPLTGGVTSTVGSVWYYKIATGSEPANYTWTLSASNFWAGAISRITGQDTIAPFANVYTALIEGPTASYPTGSHLPNVDNNLIIAGFAASQAGTWTESSGTERYDVGTTNRRIAMSSQTQASATALSITGTHSDSAAESGTATFIAIAGAGSTFIAATLDDWAFWSESISEIDAGFHYHSRDAGPRTRTAISHDVRSFELAGAKRQYELDAMVAGTSASVLNDALRRYDPGNEASPNAPYIIPVRRMWAEAIYAAVTYPLWSHFIERWPPRGMGPTYQELDLTASDGFEGLAIARVDGSLEAAFSGAQINALLDMAYWPQADRAIDTGQFVMAPQTISNGTALALIQEVANSERGIFFIDASGIATFHDSAHRGSDARSTASQTTFSDHPEGGGIPYQDLAPSDDKDRIVNDWTVSPDSSVFGAADQELVDHVSALKYRRRSESRSTRLALNSDALAQAGNLLNETAEPTLRFDSIRVMATTAAALAKCLDLRNSDRVTVERNTQPGAPAAVQTRACFIEGKSISARQAASWVFTFQLSPVSAGNYYATIVRGGPVSYYRMDTIT